jgi:hypothetical protein
MLAFQEIKARARSRCFARENVPRRPRKALATALSRSRQKSAPEPDPLGSVLRNRECGPGGVNHGERQVNRRPGSADRSQLLAYATSRERQRLLAIQPWHRCTTASAGCSLGSCGSPECEGRAVLQTATRDSLATDYVGLVPSAAKREKRASLSTPRRASPSRILSRHQGTKTRRNR